MRLASKDSLKLTKLFLLSLSLMINSLQQIYFPNLFPSLWIIFYNVQYKRISLPTFLDNDPSPAFTHFPQIMSRFWTVYMVTIQLPYEIPYMVRITLLLILPRRWLYYSCHLLHLCLVASLTMALPFISHNSFWGLLLLAKANALIFLFIFL